MTRLARSFYRQDPVSLAKALLGKRLVRLLPDAGGNQLLAVRIVETEAYLGVEDLAAHTAGGRRTPRNEAMYHDAGHLYVYFTYGMHHCCNVVASKVDDPVAVLIRAGEPVQGQAVMYTHRAKAKKDTDLCSGPAKLCQALAIDRQHNDLDMTRPDSPIWIEHDPQTGAISQKRIVTSARIGVAYAGDWAQRPLRFHLRDNPHVSRP